MRPSTPSARDWLAQHGFDPLMGARPMARLIQDKIKRPLADEMLFGKLVGGGRVKVEVKDDEDAFQHGSPEAMLYLKRLVTQAKKRGVKHLITWRRHEGEDWRPLKRPKSSWRRAMNEIGSANAGAGTICARHSSPRSRSPRAAWPHNRSRAIPTSRRHSPISRSPTTSAARQPTGRPSAQLSGLSQAEK